MVYHVEYQGAALTVLYSDEINSFLGSKDVPMKDKAAIRHVIEILANNPTWRNDKKFKKETDKIFCAKSYQVRIYGWFTRDRKLVFGCGVIKKTDKADPAVLRRADNMRIEYEANGGKK